MPIVTLLLLAVTALMGGILATYRERKEVVPAELVAAHGISASMSLASLLLSIALRTQSSMATLAPVVCLVIMLGWALVGYQVRGRRWPAWLLFGHASLAIAGIAYLGFLLCWSKGLR